MLSYFDEHGADRFQFVRDRLGKSEYDKLTLLASLISWAVNEIDTIQQIKHILELEAKEISVLESAGKIDRKKCPFCGSNNLIIYYSDDKHYVSCKYCGAHGPESKCKNEGAVKCWNTRTLTSKGRS